MDHVVKYIKKKYKFICVLANLLSKPDKHVLTISKIFRIFLCPNQLLRITIQYKL